MTTPKPVSDATLPESVSAAAVDDAGASRGAWWRRIPLAILAVSGLNVGLWIQIAPRSFFDEFPGAGHRWVAAFGPYNEHLLRDFGAMNVALGVLAAVALFRYQRTLVQAAAGAWMLFGAQHLLFHLFHVDALEGFDRIASPSAVASVVVMAAIAWWLAPARV